MPVVESPPAGTPALPPGSEPGVTVCRDRPASQIRTLLAMTLDQSREMSATANDNVRRHPPPVKEGGTNVLSPLHLQGGRGTVRGDKTSGNG